MVVLVVVNKTSISHIYEFFFEVRSFKICSFRNFEVYNTVLWTSITTLGIRPPILYIYLTENLYPLINISPFLSTPASSHQLCLNSDLQIPHINKIVQYLSFSVQLIYFIRTYFTKSTHVVANGRVSFFFMADDIYVFIHIFICSSIDGHFVCISWMLWRMLQWPWDFWYLL